MTADRAALAEAFARQAVACARLGSPLTAAVLSVLERNIAENGAAVRLLAGFGGDPVDGALALRVAGALHRAALDGDRALSRFYGTAGGTFGEDDKDALAAAVLGAIEPHAPLIGRYLEHPPQTNEVGRSAMLLGGFLTVAAETGLPLDIREIGASAGLNLNWDGFSYRFTGEPQEERWGPDASPVRLVADCKGAKPPLAGEARVRSRQGADVAPIDVTDADARRRLQTYVWGDQIDRFERLNGAIAVALERRSAVVKERARDWLPAVLADRDPGGALVVYHSIMWQYMPADEQDAVRAALERAGREASADAPLAWLRMEPPDAKALPEVRLTLWPGGGERLLGTAHPHGSSLRWVA